MILTLLPLSSLQVNGLPIIIIIIEKFKYVNLSKHILFPQKMILYYNE